MGVEVVPFDPAHLIGARVHPKQARHQALLDERVPLGMAWSALRDGTLLAIGGVGPVDGAIAGWVLFTDAIDPVGFIEIDRFVRRVIASLSREGRPVVAHVDPDYPEACRWAGLLGLLVVGPEVIDGRTMERVRA